MNKAYNKITWQNKPSTATPLNQTNLNEMSNALDTIDDRVIALDNGKVSSVTVTNTLQTGDTIATITVDGTATNIKSAQVVVDDTPSATSENPLQNKAIYEMLNNLLPEETVQGNPISISDASGLNAKACSVDLLPIQDLHGYDSPWVGGAGKNKLQNTATTQTINGVTFTVNSDGTISLSGTASDTTILDVATFSAIGGTAYKLSGCPSGGSTTKYLLSIPAVGYDSGSGYNYTPSTSADVLVRITIYSGQNTQGLVFKPMICLASAPNPDYAHFEPYENICPISGRTELNLARCGKNLIPYIENGLLSKTDGSEIVDPDNLNKRTGYIITPSVGNYTISGLDGNNLAVRIFEYTKDKTYIRNYVSSTFTNSVTISVGAGVGYIRFQGNKNIFTSNTAQAEIGATATEYTAYDGQTYTETLGQTVYGGTLDVTNGKLTIDKGIIILTGDETWNVSGGVFRTTVPNMNTKATESYLVSCCDRFPIRYADNCIVLGAVSTPNDQLYFRNNGFVADVDAWKTWLSSNNTTVIYPLATPTEITLTAEQISLLNGNNVISTDGDNINLVYSADIKAWVESQLQS